MYRNGLEYDEMVKKVTDIYLDYDIKTFPINVSQVFTLNQQRVILQRYYIMTVLTKLVH